MSTFMLKRIAPSVNDVRTALPVCIWYGYQIPFQVVSILRFNFAELFGKQNIFIGQGLTGERKTSDWMKK